MILLSAIIAQFETAFLRCYAGRILPDQRQALRAMKICRTQMSPRMLVGCSDCDHHSHMPHSCGHRLCPHCQHHESQQWLERQLQKRVPAEYFLITFTIPAQFRALAWFHQRRFYSMMMQCSWETIECFAHNDRQLQGTPGAISVLHTHSRAMEYHPHVHLVVPAGAIDAKQRLWRTKSTVRAKGEGKAPYLFNHKALAKVFRAKMLAAIGQAGLKLPPKHPVKWVVDCKHVGSGDRALIYLGRYLYRGVIRESDIVACKDGQVTFRYQHSKSGRTMYRTVAGSHFLWLILQHALPKGFRRARNHGFLHPNSKRLSQVLQIVLRLKPQSALSWLRKRPQWLCSRCGAQMIVIKTRVPSLFSPRLLAPI